MYIFLKQRWNAFLKMGLKKKTLLFVMGIFGIGMFISVVVFSSIYRNLWKKSVIQQIEIEQREENRICFRYRLDGWEELPHTFHYFYRAKTNADGCYQAAEGMGGNTGYWTKEKIKSADIVMSYGLGALQFLGEEKAALLLYSEEQKHYENICETEAFKRAFYTDGSGLRTEKETMICSYGLRTERMKRSAVLLPEFYIEYSETIESGLEKAAKKIGREMGARLTAPPAYHWCSWYYCYHNFDRVQLEEYLTGLEKMEEKPPIRYFQIDAGYFPSTGDWLECTERFPLGLQEAFERINQAGYLPGIWVGAFMVGNRSKLYRQHPDWILYDLDDKPVRPWITDNEPKPWGYQDEEYYILDTSHPDAMEYMRNVFTTLHDWGARMFKTDFMLWGLQDSSRVKRHTPGKTSVEYFREYLQMIREAIGEESYWLGCIAPFIPFVGYADGMRIGGDVGSSWNGEFGPQNMMQCLVGNNYINHNYYQIDPDAVMLREFQIRLDEREIHSLALLAAMSGSCIYTSDPLHLIKKDRQKLFLFLKPDIRRKANIPFLDEERKEMVFVQHGKNSSLIFILNKSESVLKEAYTLQQLGIPTSYSVVRVMTGEQEGLWKQKLLVDIEPHDCRLYLATSDKNPTIHYENLWMNIQ